jgi:DNA-binding CsgD family transcriptional regulator
VTDATSDPDMPETLAALCDAVDASPQPVAIYDLGTTRILAISASARSQLGLDEVDLEEFDIVERSADPAAVRQLVSLIAERDLFAWEWPSQLKMPDGERCPGFARGRKIGGLGERSACLVRYYSGPVAEQRSYDAARLLEGHDFSDELTDGERRSDERHLAELVARLQRHLARIAQEVEATGLVTIATTPEPTAVPGLADLSARQWEVVTRLLRGERVTTIARAMFLSPSTVRNHLTTIYRKVGVSSQAELLELLHDARQRSAQGTGP